MPYFSLSDAVEARKIVVDEEKVVVYGTIQTAPRGSWVITSRDGKVVTIYTDDAFKERFVEVAP